VKSFNKEFVNVDNDQLFELILAANCLKIEHLLDITSQAIAEQIKGKTPEQIRQQFNIEVRRTCATRTKKVS
jgi:S-phase kinase-associated protein 1